MPAMNDSRRIAIFVSTSGHSGVDRAIKNLVPALVERGYSVDLLKVRRHGPHFEFSHPNYRVVDLGTRHTYLAVATIARYLREFRPAVMFSDKDRVNRTALLAAWIARCGTRLVFSVGTTVSIDLTHRGMLERWIQRLSMRYLYPRAFKVIVSSEGVADDMSRYTGLRRSLIHAVPRPIIPDEQLRRTFSGIDHPWFAHGEPPVILGVGELSDRKAFDILLRAFARLRQRRPCRLMILGKGMRREQLQALATELGVTDDFQLPGFVSDPYAYMAHASVFAMTSRWEGLPLALVEAMAMGTPVVSTDCPSGAAEALAGGRHGPLVPVDDIEGIADALESALQTPVPRTQLIAAVHRFTVSAATDAYLDAFELPHRAPQST